MQRDSPTGAQVWMNSNFPKVAIYIYLHAWTLGWTSTPLAPRRSVWKRWNYGDMAVWGLRRTPVAVFSYVKEIPHVLSCLASDLEHRCWVGSSHRDASLVHQPEGQSLEWNCVPAEAESAQVWPTLLESWVENLSGKAKEGRGGLQQSEEVGTGDLRGLLPCVRGRSERRSGSL